MTHYRQRPLVVEAMRFHDGNCVEATQWLEQRNVNWRERTSARGNWLYLDIGEDLTAVVADGCWIVLTVPDGRFYSVMDDAKFTEKFEPAPANEAHPFFATGQFAFPPIDPVPETGDDGPRPQPRRFEYPVC